MMKRRIINCFLGLTIIASGFLIACNNGDESEPVTESEVSVVEPEILQVDETAESEIPEMVGTITIGTTGDTMTNVLMQVCESMQKTGWKLKVETYADYATPYDELAAGKIDCVLNTHSQFVKSYESKNPGAVFDIADYVYYCPYRLFAGKSKSLDDMKNGSSVSIPSSEVGEARAINLLREMGYITVRSDVYELPTLEDIEKNDMELNIVRQDTDDVESLRNRFDYVILDSDHALAAGIYAIDSSLYTERATSEDMMAYSYALVVRSQGDGELVGEESDTEETDDSEEAEDEAETATDYEWLEPLKESLKCGEVRDFLFVHCAGGLAPVRSKQYQASDEMLNEELTEEMTTSD